MEDSYDRYNITLQLFTDEPDVILFPLNSKNSFTIKPNSREEKNFIVYPKKEQSNSTIINCVKVYTRNIYKSSILIMKLLFQKLMKLKQLIQKLKIKLWLIIIIKIQ